MNKRIKKLAGLTTLLLGSALPVQAQEVQLPPETFIHEAPAIQRPLPPIPRNEFLTDSLYQAHDLGEHPHINFRVYDVLPPTIEERANMEVSFGPRTQLPEVGRYFSHNDSLVLYLPVIEAIAQHTDYTEQEIIHRTMKHEIGHGIVDAISDSIGPSSYSEYELTSVLNSLELLIALDERSRSGEEGAFNAFPGLFNQMVSGRRRGLLDHAVRHLVNEGIGMCYEGVPVPEVTWPEDIYDIFSSESYNRFVYENGHALMKPIVDEGVRGIVETLRHMPTHKNFMDLPAWRDTILTHVRESFLADSIIAAHNIRERFPDYEVKLFLTADHDSITYIGRHDYDPPSISLYWDKITAEGKRRYLDQKPTMSGGIQDSLSLIIETRRRVVEHELGHAYTHRIANLIENTLPREVYAQYSLGEEFKEVLKPHAVGSMPPRVRSFLDEHPGFMEYIVGRQIVEGIAEWFETQDHRRCEGVWSTTMNWVNSFKRYYDLLYGGGCQMYGPILESLGPDQGIACILERRPDQEEFWNKRREYRSRLIDECSADAVLLHQVP